MPQDALIRAVVRVQNGNKVGSGFLLVGGYVLTAFHTVGESRQLEFKVCNDQNQFSEPIEVDIPACFQLLEEEGDLAVFKLTGEWQSKLKDRCLYLAEEGPHLLRCTFSTFGFPQGTPLNVNGNPYNTAALDDINSGNEHGIKKLTLSAPGNIGKGYSGGPIFIPGQGVVGMVTQKWPELAVGLPTSVILEKIPALQAATKPFFPPESEGKFRCLVVCNSAAEKVLNFMQYEVGDILDELGKKEELHFECIHYEKEGKKFDEAMQGASCICLWLEKDHDIHVFSKDVRFENKNIIVFNYNEKDQKKLEKLTNAFPNSIGFPYNHPSFKVIPGFHCFNALENYPGYNASDGKLAFVQQIVDEFIDSSARVREIFLEFDYLIPRAKISEACIMSDVKKFLFYALEGTTGCGLDILVQHGINILTQSEKPLIRMLDWEYVQPSTPERVFDALNLRRENLFSHEGESVFIFRNFLATGIDKATCANRIKLVEDLMSYCQGLPSPTWKGRFHFFIINTARGELSGLESIVCPEACMLTMAPVSDLRSDYRPINNLEEQWNRTKLPERMHSRLKGKLPNHEEYPFVGTYLSRVCELLEMPQIFHELTHLS